MYWALFYVSQILLFKCIYSSKWLKWNTLWVSCLRTRQTDLINNPQFQYMRPQKLSYYACVMTLSVTLHKELSPIAERNGVNDKTQDWFVLKATYLSLRNFLVDGISLLSSVSSNELHTIQLLGRISTHGLDFCRGTCWGVHFPQ